MIMLFQKSQTRCLPFVSVVNEVGLPFMKVADPGFFGFCCLVSVVRARDVMCLGWEAIARTDR